MVRKAPLVELEELHLENVLAGCDVFCAAGGAFRTHCWSQI